jgi:hypothetical protein
MNLAILIQSSTPAPVKPLSLTSDPQFWIATGIAVIAAAFLLRALLPKLGMKISKGTSSKATLTVDGKPIPK